MAKNTGGPAFPCQERNDYGKPIMDHPGMSLRDYFAAHALGASIYCGQAGLILNGAGPENFAKVAYETADAMLAERAKADSK